MSRRTLVLIIIAVAIVLFSLLYFFKFKHHPDINTILKPQDIANILLRGAKLDIPFTNSEVAILYPAVPKGLNIVLDSHASNISLQEVRYEGGKSGYSFKYILNRPLAESYNNLIISLTHSSDWQTSYVTLANQAGIIEAASKDFKLRVTALATMPTVTSVTVDVINVH